MYVVCDDFERLTLPAEWADQGSLLTVGSFDGIHIGHQQLILDLVAEAKQQGHLSGLVTFYPHPTKILYPRQPTRYLTTPGEKTALLEPLGLDWLAIVLFTPQLAALAPRDFVHHLCQQVRMQGLWVGTDFALGQDRQGDVVTLRTLGGEMGFQVHEIAPVIHDGQRVSSTYIRNVLYHGQVEQAARLLQRYYSLSGEVIHGAERGRCIGFPTANLDVRPDRVVPADGIYAGFAYLGAERYQAVVYIGHRPSFDEGMRSVEAHLLDFTGDLYGCDLVIQFVARLRADRRFTDIDALVAQIARDTEQARQVLDALRGEIPNSPLKSAQECDILLAHWG